MQMPVLIEAITGNGYRAKSGEPLPLSAEGATRDEALQKLRQMVEERLHQGVQLASFEVPASDADNPWLRMAGIYDANDPDVQEWLQEMKRYREEVERDPNYP
jgi:hypothetical protein